MPKCGRRNFVDYDLTGKNLIGFKIVIASYTNSRPYRYRDRRNIRSIAPIIDESIDCMDADFYKLEFQNMETFVGTYEKVLQVLLVDYTSMYYGTLDGYSFCKDSYDLVLEYKRGFLETTDQPLWMTVHDNCIIISGKTAIDPSDAVEVTVRVQREGKDLIVGRKFIARLICNIDSCNPWVGGKSRKVAPIDNAKQIDLTQGFVQLHPFEDTWYVPRMFYRLTKVKMWKNDINTSGFMVTYERPDSDEFDGWPLVLEHMFGSVMELN